MEKAGTTFRRLPKVTRRDFKEVTKALRKRFEWLSMQERTVHGKVPGGTGLVGVQGANTNYAT